MLTRRRALGAFAAATAMTMLPGCRELVESAVDSCPSDPAESGGVDWVPDVMHPVFWGFQELTAEQGAPRDMRIYYPTVSGTPSGAPILKLCITRWPVVLFLHGLPPPGIPTTGWYRKWERIPMVLARSGYVVVAPNHNAQLPFSDFGPAVNAAVQDIDFARGGWAESKWVDKRPSSTAVAGHSNGAVLAARVAASRPDFGAFASLGGGFATLNDPQAAMAAGGLPSFFMAATGSTGAENENIDGSQKFWDKLTQPKYAAVYPGGHFDYLPASATGGTPRGPCDKIEQVTADLLALFIAANVTVSTSRTKIPVDLKVPQVQLTQQQEFFAGSHLQGQDSFQATGGCRLDLRWKVTSATGTRRLGP